MGTRSLTRVYLSEKTEPSGLTKEEMKSYLKENVIDIEFIKVNGDTRVMKCTLMAEHLPATGIIPDHKRAENPDTLAVWDLDKEAWRSFNIESLVSFSTGRTEICIMNLYRQFDGYMEGHGAELAEFLSPIRLVNGFSALDMGGTCANGMGCLAAQMVAHFKTAIGQFYLTPIDDLDQGQDYIYHVYENSVRVEDYDGETVFSGSWSAFYKATHQKPL